MSATKEPKNNTLDLIQRGRLARNESGAPIAGCRANGRSKITQRTSSCILRMQKGVSWPAGSRREAIFLLSRDSFFWVSGASYGPGSGCSINYFVRLHGGDVLRFGGTFLACLPANYCLEIVGRSTAVFYFPDLALFISSVFLCFEMQNDKKKEACLTL